MCDIGWYVISTGISVTDLLIKAIVGEIMVNSTAEASGFFCCSDTLRALVFWKRHSHVSISLR